MNAILDKIIVTEVQEVKKEGSLIETPDTLRSPIVFGRIISAGQDCFKEEPVKVTQSSVVVFPRNEAYSFKYKGDTFLVIAEKHILAIV